MSDFSERLSKLSPARLALLALELQHTVEAAEQRRSEPIAIVGTGCRLPGGADSPEAFWRLLEAGVDAIGEVPRTRWDRDAYYDADPQAPGRMTTRWGGFVEPIDRFDAGFFNIAPREAISLDPQQRLLLEVTWEALEDAAQSADELHETRTGVFVGIGTSDYAHLYTRAGNLADIDVYRATGCISHSPASGRIAYVLGLQGPAISVDTACSSSLVAVHLACQSLRMDECRMALAGGVNAVLTPELTIALSNAGLMAPDGRCKTFDAAANGFVRGEGCGMVVLKRLSDAVADGDRVLALIRGSAVNQDGRSNGLTAPNGPAQEAVIREALTRAGVSPHGVGYVEAHGTGTELGDPIEVQALGAVLARGRSEATPLAIGSVKTNIGHLESAAGIAGLIKVVLALQHRTIPRHLHFSSPNPLIVWDQFAIRVAAHAAPWEPIDGRRIGAVSAFGFSGTNAHVVVEEAPAGAGPGAASGRTREVLTLSGKSEAAVTALAARYAPVVEAGGAALADVCFTAHVGRAALGHRVALVAETAAGLASQLRAVAAGTAAGGVARGEVRSGRRPRVAWLFTGQGAQYAGMGAELYASAPPFRAAMDRCAAALAGTLEVPLLEVLYGSAGGRLTETAYAQPALFAVQMGLAALWQAWGVSPGAVLGHSVGEFAAACVAGVLDVAPAARLVAARGRLMQELPAAGAMAAVWAPDAVVRAALSDGVTIAAVNGPATVVVAGGVAAVATVCGRLAARGVRTERLAVGHAFHTRHMTPMVAAFGAVAGTLAPAGAAGPGPIPWVSTVTGTWGDASTGTAAYWTAQIEAPVQYERGLATLVAAGYDAFVEIGPAPTLVGLGRASWPAVDAVWGASLRPGHDGWATLLETVGTLWVRGAAIDWAGFDGGARRQRVALPTYPFQRQRFWIEAAPPTPHAAEFAAATIQGHAAAAEASLYHVEWRPLPEADSEKRFLPSIASLAEPLDDAAARLDARLAVTKIAAAEPELDRLCVAYVREALLALGWSFAQRDLFTAGELAEQLGVVVRHRRLFERLLEMLREDGLLSRFGSVWEVTSEAGDESALLLERLRASYPGFAAELTLLARCGPMLGEVLAGRVDPLQLLFPDGSMDDLEAVYGRAPLSEFHNELIATALAREIEARGSQAPLRILEIGGGTGATTRHLLPRLAAGGIEYLFTDISPYFTGRAAEMFAAAGVETRVLDIEQAPGAQGFTGQRFDVVIAANVLHATRDLDQTMQHVRALLAPGALLVLWENVRAQRWIDLVFGLTDGWWRFTDVDRRTNHPLISVAQWQTLLKSCGAEDSGVWSMAGGRRSPYALLFSRWPVRTPSRRERQSLIDTPAAWTVLTDRGGLGPELIRQLQAEGESCTLVTETDAEAIKARLEASASDRGHRHIICLWGLDADPPDLDAGSDAERWQTSIGAALSKLVAALKSLQHSHPRLWLITRGAQPISNGAPAGAVALAQAPLWGWGRVIRLEGPQVWGGSIDLDPAVNDLVTSARSLRSAIASAVGEDEVGVRAGRQYVPRLVSLPAPAAGSPRCDPDAWYLITGGLGVVGLELAIWLTDCGARHLALVSRTGIDAAEPRSIERRHAVGRLEARGVTIQIESVDVAESHQVAALFERLRASGRRVRGIIHGAGVSAPAPLDELDAARIAEVMRPKVAGGWNLHRESLRHDLDWFVLLSSAAAIWGSKSLAAYAAASQFLDALAHHRRSIGLPALSVNWGRWQGRGMVSDEAHEWLQEIGLAAFAPEDGIRSLERLMQAGVAQATAANVDWDRFKQFYAAASCDALLDEIVEGDRPAAENAPAAALQPAASRPELPAAVHRFEDDLREKIAQALGLLSRDLPLNESINLFGFDSLMAVRVRDQVKRQWNVSIPIAEFLKGRTVAELTGYGTALPTPPSSSVVHVGEPGGEASASRAANGASVDDMSDGDVDAVLRRMLAERTSHV